VAKPGVEPSGWVLLTKGAKYEVLTWIGIVGGALTLFTNLGRFEARRLGSGACSALEGVDTCVLGVGIRLVGNSFAAGMDAGLIFSTVLVVAHGRSTNQI